MTKRQENRKTEQGTACEHCGALVFEETKRCPQCGKFPVRLHHCPRCHCVSPREADRCWNCYRVFDPNGDYL